MDKYRFGSSALVFLSLLTLSPCALAQSSESFEACRDRIKGEESTYYQRWLRTMFCSDRAYTATAASRLRRLHEEINSSSDPNALAFRRAFAADTTSMDATDALNSYARSHHLSERGEWVSAHRGSDGQLYLSSNRTRTGTNVFPDLFGDRSRHTYEVGCTLGYPSAAGSDAPRAYLYAMEGFPEPEASTDASVTTRATGLLTSRRLSRECPPVPTTPRDTTPSNESASDANE